jgi:hypothetical protein
MTEELHLFIGGSRDGERLKVPDLRRISVRVQKGRSRLSIDEEEIYRRELFRLPSGHLVLIYVLDSIDMETAGEMLLDGYRSPNDQGRATSGAEKRP